MKAKKRVGVHYTTYEFQLPGDRNFYNVDFYASGEVSDCGIGAYEFWGAKGVDSRLCVEEFDINLMDVEALDPLTGEEYVIALGSGRAKHIAKALFDDDKVFEAVLDRLDEALHEEHEPEECE